jgi:uncharacterized membrane protein
MYAVAGREAVHNGPVTEPAWRRPHPGEHRWPVAIAIVAAIALQGLTPQQLAFDPRWFLPAVESALLLGLVAVNPYRINRESAAVRTASLALVAVATVALLWSTARLVVLLVRGDESDHPGDVLLSGAIIWLTNVIVFALWYWLLDRGGPAARANARRVHPDFLFAQMTLPDLVHVQWRPVFVDYLYLAFTNSTAFSPTDTMPLVHWAKLAMMVQSCVSFLIVVLVIARAVNALN